ncbi:CLUMA_CG004769, isoform A [Clunio marinus]|uniref:rRNA-processing protein UTP23 homolog n=1 Tax=Clunio marinus TaxID=568069 RepID=A0A1J1HY64_9DIPT|nr:CLUMA_CG004769, isoform A [Clunio marinus]
MKVTRFKKACKRIYFYINNFNYRPPIQVLIDGTFCFAAIKNKFSIEDQLKSYLQLELRLLTTPCMIIESEKLGHKLHQVTQKLKSFNLNKCGHEKNPLAGSECIKTMVKDNHFIVATQDRDLQDWLRHQIGKALIYLHNVVPHLDEPSDASKKFVIRKSKATTRVSTFEDEQLMNIKKKEGLLKESSLVRIKNIKKKKKGGPNPLSCKKKKINIQTKIKKEKMKSKIKKKL